MNYKSFSLYALLFFASGSSMDLRGADSIIESFANLSKDDLVRIQLQGARANARMYKKIAANPGLPRELVALQMQPVSKFSVLLQIGGVALTVVSLFSNSHLTKKIDNWMNPSEVLLKNAYADRTRLSIQLDKVTDPMRIAEIDKALETNAAFITSLLKKNPRLSAEMQHMTTQENAS